MIKLIMRKTYLHNYTTINVDKEIETKKIIYKKNIKNVDINKLLNRVKINQRKELKQKYILLGLFFIAICGFATFLIL